MNRHARIILLLAGLAGWLITDTHAYAQSVTTMYRRAFSAYRQGKLPQAARILNRILRKYPGHEPSNLLFGTIQFRAGRTKKAARYFKRVSPESVGADIAYQYGITMFLDKDCDRALPAFGRVLKRSRAYNLAVFYSGVCHYRASRYQRAERFLSAAKNLPANLAQTRRNMLLEARKRALAERRGVSTPAAPYVIVPAPAYSYSYYGAVPPPAGQGQPAAPEKPPPPPSANFSTAFTPSFTVEQIQKQESFHGFSDKDSNTQNITIKGAFNARYDMKPRANGGQPYVQAQLEFDRKASKSDGSQTNYVVFKDDPGKVVEQEQPVASTDSTVGNLLIKPEAGFPVTGSINIKAAYTYRRTLPDLKTEGQTGSQGPSGSISAGFGDLNVSANASMTDNIDDKGQPTKNTIAASLSASRTWDNVTGTFGLDYNDSANLVVPAPNVTTTQGVSASIDKSWDTFSLNLNGAFKTFTPPADKPKQGELSSVKAEIGATKTFGLGISLTLTGTMLQLTEFRKTVTRPTETTGLLGLQDDAAEPTTVDAVADGQKVTGAANFSIAPYDWLKANASYSTTTSSFGLRDPGLKQPFEQSVVSDESQFTIKVTVQKTF